MPNSTKNMQKFIIDENTLLNERMILSEKNFVHKPIQTEKSLYSLVTSGDIEGLVERKPSLRKAGLGCLSSNPLRNILFHLVINAANCARHCIAAGMDTETAYTLSDLYIRKADLAFSIEELEKINHHMMFDYTSRMRALIVPKNDYPEIIQRAIEYIDANLHQNVYVKDVADHVCLSVSSFSHKFSDCLGCSFSNYLEDRRFYLAQKYLRYTDLSITEIAVKLSFCNPSYFATRFKIKTGVSPQQYRGQSSQMQMHIQS